jgi:hypothetical protein
MVGINLAFSLHLQVLRGMPAIPSYIDYRDTYLAVGLRAGKIAEVRAMLSLIGLPSTAVSDWRKPAA